MANGFNINTNLNINQFTNSIGDFNKAFSNSLNQTQDAISGNVSFDEIFNTIGNKQAEQKIENLSSTAKMANSIGQGFSKGISEVSNLGKEAEEAFETFATGGDISVHEVMIASQKSGLAMQMAIQLRNQMINAYNEFKNMSV